MVKILCCIVIAALPVQPAFATRDGEIDLSFGGNGYRFLDTVPSGGVPSNERGLFAHRLANGRLLVAMQAQQPDAQRAITAVLGQDGDQLVASASFPQNFISQLDPPLRGFGVDASERLLIGGNTYDLVVQRNDPVVVRALPPGYLPDPDYGTGGEARPFSGADNALLLALTALPDGRSIACGALIVPGTGVRGYCVRLTADGALDWSFGTDARLVFSPPNVSSSSVSSVRVDAQGRLLIAGGAVMQASGDTHAFTGRATADGLMDPEFCASQCTDPFVQQAGPGYRIDTGTYAGSQFVCDDIVERADGVIVAARFPQFVAGSILTRRYNPAGRQVGGASFTQGEDAGGCGSIAVQPDNKLVVAYTYGVGGTQRGALVRLVPEPTLALFFDPLFSDAASNIQAPLPGGMLSPSNECVYALLEDSGILCVGLTRVGSNPDNLDFMMARVRNGTPDLLFGDGFGDVN